MKSMCHEARRNSPSVADWQPDVLLHAHHVADRLVLDRAQLARVDRPRGVVVARAASSRSRSQQAADVVGAERRAVVAHCHRSMPPCSDPLEPDVVLGEGRRGRRRRGHVAQLGELQLRSNVVRSGRCSIEVIHHEKCSARQTRRRQAPSSASSSAARRRSEPRASASARTRTSCEREVQALRAGRRDDVRGVAGEEQPAVLHRLDDEAAHPVTPFSSTGPFGERPAVEPEPELELLPDALVGPLVDVLVGRHCRYRRLSSGERMLSSAKPRSCCA